MPTCTPYIRMPRSGQAVSLDARRVALAYKYPATFTGKGYVGGIIELGGAYRQSDLAAYFANLGLPVPKVTSVDVGAGKPVSDPNGADFEVALDIQVAGAVAPGATYRVYFAENTDAGFLAAVRQAAADGCHGISISWGGPENQWNTATMHSFDAEFAALRAKGVPVFCAAGDNGSGDGETGKHVDFPSSSPNAVGCGGTRLTLDASGARLTETVWNDSSSSATGGGVSAQFPGRQVPDVAGNADPDSGYEIVCGGQSMVVGGTSAVAPLMLGLYLLLLEASGG